MSTDTPTKCLISLHNSPFPIYIYPDIDVYYLQYKNYRHYVPNMKGGGGAEISLVGKAPGSNNDRLNMNSAMFFRTYVLTH